MAQESSYKSEFSDINQARICESIMPPNIQSGAFWRLAIAVSAGILTGCAAARVDVGIFVLAFGVLFATAIHLALRRHSVMCFPQHIRFFENHIEVLSPTMSTVWSYADCKWQIGKADLRHPIKEFINDSTFVIHCNDSIAICGVDKAFRCQLDSLLRMKIGNPVSFKLVNKTKIVVDWLIAGLLVGAAVGITSWVVSNNSEWILIAGLFYSVQGIMCAGAHIRGLAAIKTGKSSGMPVICLIYLPVLSVRVLLSMTSLQTTIIMTSFNCFLCLAAYKAILIRITMANRGHPHAP